MKTKNLKKLFLFAKHVKEGKKDKVQISIFDRDGHSATDTLGFDGKAIHFINHYTGYKSSQDNYKCQEMTLISFQIEVNVCKNQKGKKFPALVALLAKKDKISQLSEKYVGGAFVYSPSSK